MVHSKNRLLIALITHNAGTNDRIKWEIIIAGILLILLLFVILILCDRYYRIFCCPTTRATGEQMAQERNDSLVSLNTTGTGHINSH